MSFQSIEEIIDFAIKNEKDAVAFYTDLCEQETVSSTKKTFIEFADQEKKHQKMLEDFNADKDQIAKYKYKWIPDIKRSDYMTDVEYTPGMPYDDILLLAMKREEKSLALYNELAGKTDNDACIQLFKMLAQEEAKHKLGIETIFDDIRAEQGD